MGSTVITDMVLPANLVYHKAQNHATLSEVYNVLEEGDWNMVHDPSPTPIHIPQTIPLIVFLPSPLDLCHVSDNSTNYLLLSLSIQQSIPSPTTSEKHYGGNSKYFQFRVCFIILYFI